MIHCDAQIADYDARHIADPVEKSTEVSNSNPIQTKFVWAQLNWKRQKIELEPFLRGPKIFVHHTASHSVTPKSP